jgi:hypothetical protein
MQLADKNTMLVPGPLEGFRVSLRTRGCPNCNSNRQYRDDPRTRCVPDEPLKRVELSIFSGERTSPRLDTVL